MLLSDAGVIVAVGAGGGVGVDGADAGFSEEDDAADPESVVTAGEDESAALDLSYSRCRLSIISNKFFAAALLLEDVVDGTNFSGTAVATPGGFSKPGPISSLIVALEAVSKWNKFT